jgi:hypothetical protein
MPIPNEDIHKNFVVAALDETVAQVQARLPARRDERAFKYIVLPAGDGRYIVVRWNEIEALARAQGPGILNSTFRALQGLPRSVEAVDQDSMGKSAATEIRDEQPGKRLVVLAAGQVIGLLTREVLDAQELGSDPFAAPPPMVLGAEEEAAASPPTAGAEPEAAPAAPPVDTRVINAVLEDPVSHKAMKSQPIQARKPYELRFDVGQKRAEAFAAVSGVGHAIQEAAGDDKFVTILVVLEPGDFTLYGVDSLEIVVPRKINAPSKNAASFTIEAKKEGTGTLNAIFYINGNMFQKLTMTIQVGGQVPEDEDAVTAQAVGLTLSSAVAVPAHPRDQMVNVMLIAKEAGYQVIVQGGGVARAFLNISQAEIAGWLKYARSKLKDIVHLQDKSGNYLYQSDNTSIPADVHQAALKTMAGVGLYLLEELFYGNSGPDARAMGDLLKKLSREHQLNVQVAAERFFFPWSFLYDGDDPDNPDPKLFWGFKHIIEYLPEFSVSTPINFNPAIEVGDTVDIAFVCNNSIDTQFSRPIVQGQREFLNGLPNVSVKEYPTTQDLFTLLKGPDSPPLIYFYCHAVSKFPDEGGGADDSTVALTDGKADVRTMKMRARTSGPTLTAAPLIFLNACESAELSPYLYDGLMPYFIARGARGMIGTEVETPALFAAEFAKEFLKRFIAGGITLGELLRDMRIEYLEQKNNIMGLVYALYSSGEVCISRAG